MNGRNFLINTDGKPKKYGFYQNLIIEAESPQRAGLLAKAKIRHDKELKKVTLNTGKDSPVVDLHTFWELDIAEDVSDLEHGRTFYPEKKWWQFWKKNGK
jgi:hypothetical protein